MEVSEDLYNIVSIQNIDNEDFEFRHNNVPYLLRAGEVKNFIKTTASLAVKHLIDKIINKEDPSGKMMTNALRRETLASQIVRKEEKYTRPEAPTDQEINEKVNEITDLDKVLRAEKVGLPVEVLDPVVEVNKDIRTKAGLIEYAKVQLGMNVEDPETKEAFAKMTFTQLKKELDYRGE